MSQFSLKFFSLFFHCRVRNWALKLGVDLWEFGRQFTKISDIKNVSIIAAYRVYIFHFPSTFTSAKYAHFMYNTPASNSSIFMCADFSLELAPKINFQNTCVIDLGEYIRGNELSILWINSQQQQP